MKKIEVVEKEREGVPEILSGFGGNISEEFHFDSTGGNVTDGDIEEDDWVFRVWRTHVPLHTITSY
jgi:hypothetical protein